MCVLSRIASTQTIPTTMVLLKHARNFFLSLLFHLWDGVRDTEVVCSVLKFIRKPLGWEKDRKNINMSTMMGMFHFYPEINALLSG